MKQPTLFLSHGGGPWPYMKQEMPGVHDALERSLIDLRHKLVEPPRAVLMISAHWEESEFVIMSHPHPPMVYDYYGFPEHTYHVKYPAPGSPALAERVQSLLKKAGLPNKLNTQRGFDHGAFVPMAILYPEAQIPMIQLSIQKKYDPALHIQLGKVLAPLRDEGVLIIGSGLSYHNLRQFGPEARIPSREFDAWLNKTLSLQDPNKITDRLIHWSQAPSARAAHPREDHLIPLMVAWGAAFGEKIEQIYHEDQFFGGLSVSSFRFGETT